MLTVFSDYLLFSYCVNICIQHGKSSSTWSVLRSKHYFAPLSKNNITNRFIPDNVHIVYEVDYNKLLLSNSNQKLKWFKNRGSLH